VFRKETDGDWVTMGVLYYKAPHKSSSSGNEFSVWKLTDLRHSAQTDESRSHQKKLDYIVHYHAVQPLLLDQHLFYENLDLSFVRMWLYGSKSTIKY
jgi:hypothetical protein